MSGHSKWSTIKRQKGATDIKRSQTFTKIANALTIAARTGGTGDADSNPRLRESLEEARRVNMPKENINRAIDRGLGKLPGQTLEEVTYEGFGPEKTAFFLEGVTDNRLRTNQEVKHIFERAGGSLGGAGSTAYMFKRVGEIKIKTKGGEKDLEILELIDLGVDDVEDLIEDGVLKYLISVKETELGSLSNIITLSGYQIERSGLTMKPTILVVVNDKEKAEKVLGLTEKLEDMDDIQNVYANFDIPEDIL